MFTNTPESLVGASAIIAKLREEIERISIDPVTGLAGRGVFDKALDVEFARARREGNLMAVIMLDVDHFKAVNDTYGHITGDLVLRKIGDAIKATQRITDIAARYGGEEFVLIVNTRSAKAACFLSQKIRKAIARDVVFGDGKSVTVSVGYSILTPGDKSGEDVLQRADTALYSAKAAGRNCVRST